jgi:hypothetical protein
VMQVCACTLIVVRLNGCSSGGSSAAKTTTGIYHLRLQRVPEICKPKLLTRWSCSKSALFQVVWCLLVEALLEASG